LVFITHYLVHIEFTHLWINIIEGHVHLLGSIHPFQQQGAEHDRYNPLNYPIALVMVLEWNFCNFVMFHPCIGKGSRECWWCHWNNGINGL